MKIKEALDFFLNLKKDSVEKSEIEIYDKYQAILSDLLSRNLSPNQIQAIESELETLNLNANPDNRKKYLSQKLSEFKNFLKANLGLVPDRYYTSYGIFFGIILGVLAQFYFGIYSMLVGMITGLFIGAFMDSKAKKQGRVLKTKN